MTIEEAKRKCKEDSNYYIAWTYEGYENERCWAKKKWAEEYRDTVEVPVFAATKAEAARKWKVFRCLYAEKLGLEQDVIVDIITD